MEYMKMKRRKPYYYFQYDDKSGNLGRNAIIYNVMARKMQYLLKPDLNKAEDIRKFTPILQILLNSVDLVLRWNKLNDYIRRVEVALDIINMSFSKNPQQTCEMYGKVAKILGDYEEEVHYSRKHYYETMQGEDIPIKKFKAMFDYYLDLYKEYYCIVSSFPFYCLDIIGGKVNPSLTQEDYLLKESKEKVERLSSPLILKRHPISYLTEGCNRHIRNALSHENRHTFIDDGNQVKLVDVNSKRKIVYQKSFTVKEFEQALVDLVVTINALRSTIIIFNINEIQTITKILGFPKHTPKEIGKIAFLAAKDSMLDFESMQLTDENTVSFVVREQGRRKTDYIVRVGPFSQKVEIPDIPPADHQLARFLQIVYIQTGRKFKTMAVTLLDFNDNEVGSIETEAKNFSSKNCEDFLRKVSKNTIPKGYKLER